MLRKFSFAALALSLASFASAADIPKGEVGPDVKPFTVRPGYRVTLAATGMQEVRFIELGDNGLLFVSQPDHGRIICLKDLAADGKYQTQTTLITGKPKVHAMQWFKGELWFATSGAVFKMKVKADGTADGEPEQIETGDLPEGGGHWYRSLLVDDDGFYTSIGDDGNLNDHYELKQGDITSEREKIWHFKLDGSDKKLFCTGIRNTEKLLYRPGTKDIYGCDHGSDNFGAKFGEKRGTQPVTDLFPPDKFNHYVQDGFYGHPFVMPFHMPRPEFASRPDIIQLAAKMTPPAWNNGAHWANNGWTFLKQDKLTGQAGDAIIAFHGSWNSIKRVGYCIQRIEFDPWTGNPCGSQTLVSTLKEDGNSDYARPVDVTETPDGSVLWSSDSSRQIYRLERIK